MSNYSNNNKNSRKRSAPTELDNEPALKRRKIILSPKMKAALEFAETSRNVPLPDDDDENTNNLMPDPMTLSLSEMIVDAERDFPSRILPVFQLEPAELPDVGHKDKLLSNYPQTKSTTFPILSILNSKKNADPCTKTAVPNQNVVPNKNVVPKPIRHKIKQPPIILEDSDEDIDISFQSTPKRTRKRKLIQNDDLFSAEPSRKKRKIINHLAGNVDLLGMYEAPYVFPDDIWNMIKKQKKGLEAWKVIQRVILTSQKHAADYHAIKCAKYSFMDPMSHGYSRKALIAEKALKHDTERTIEEINRSIYSSNSVVFESCYSTHLNIDCTRNRKRAFHTKMIEECVELEMRMKDSESNLRRMRATVNDMKRKRKTRSRRSNKRRR